MPPESDRNATRTETMVEERRVNRRAVSGGAHVASGLACMVVGVLFMFIPAVGPVIGVALLVIGAIWALAGFIRA